MGCPEAITQLCWLMRSAPSQSYNNSISHKCYKCAQDRDNDLCSPESVSVCKATRWLQTMRVVLTQVIGVSGLCNEYSC